MGTFTIKITEVVIKYQSRSRDEGDTVIVTDKPTVVLGHIIFAGAVRNGAVGKSSELRITLRRFTDGLDAATVCVAVGIALAA